MKSLDNLKNEVLFSHMDETIAAGIFEGKTYPWEVLADIGAFILELGKTLSADEYDRQGEDVWIARSARVFPTAYIHGPAIIGKNAEVRHCAFIRGNAIVGEDAVVGNSTELKMFSCLIKSRCRIIIMSGIPFWDLSPIWEPVRLHQM